MSHTITAKLNEDARVFQTGENTGFGFRLGERYYDRETKKSEYTNYEGAVFSKNEKQIEFWKSALVKGAIITVTCDQLKIDSYTSDNGTTYLKNQMQNCRMDNVFTSDLPPHAPSQTPQQQPPAQQGFAQPQAQPQTFGSFGNAPAPQASTDPWALATPTGEPAQQGATIEQIKAHEQVGGDYNKALALGWVSDSSIPF